MSNMCITLGSRRFDFNHEKAVMAIVNCTPDSFFDGGKFTAKKSLRKRIRQCVTEGADLLDLGGESTRPGSQPVSAKEELKRIIPAFEIAREMAPTLPISIDTTKSQVAKEMIARGADLINDISAMTFDRKMAGLVADQGLPALIMHMQGKPRDMQTYPRYKNVTREVIQYLKIRITELRKIGIREIIADPGIGFGKTMEHNFELIDRLDEFAILGIPILMGLSRKSLIGKALGLPVEKRLPATMALNLVALNHGAALIRVHDVKEGKQTLILHEKMRAHRNTDA